MRILAFETSAKAASVAMIQEDCLVAEYVQNSGQTHSRTLMQMAQNLLANCDLTAKDVDAVACAQGPGSFTGVRIGVAAAKGFAWGREIPLVGISTLLAMAMGYPTVVGSLIVPAMDARRSQVYTAVFLQEEDGLRQLVADCAISLEELGNMLNLHENPKILVGDGAQLCYNALSNSVSGLVLAPEHLRMQRAGGVALAARQQLLQGDNPPAAAMVPNYLRLSQAERERIAKLTI